MFDDITHLVPVLYMGSKVPYRTRTVRPQLYGDLYESFSTLYLKFLVMLLDLI